MTQQPPAPAKRDDDSGGIREVLHVAFPLVMASSSHALKLFADRVMLSYHSADALAASLSAGIMCFCTMTLFMGTAGYANTFVAQYTGARREDRVGESVWQGMYVALLGGLVLAVLSLWAEPLFRWAGHTPGVQRLQTQYFRIVVSGGFFALMTTSTLSFWSGRGKTWTVFAISGSTVLINVALNWFLIYGHAGFPRLGIAGAAIATVASGACGLCIALALFWSKENRERFDTFPRKTFDPALFRRLVRFGLPNGINFFLDIAAFNLFVLLIGRIGPDVNAAAAIAFSMNAIAFIPMIGLGMTINILVGHSVGGEDIPHAKRSVRSARTLVLLYMGTLATLFVFLPGAFTRLFDASGDVEILAQHFMRFIAAYLVFDGLFIVYHSAVKGAGDTHFSMWAGVVMAWVFMALPAYLMWRAGFSVWWLWSVFVAYIMLAGCVFYWRYRGGAWETMRVIEVLSENAE